MKPIYLVLLATLAACADSRPSFTVAGHSLRVSDTGYVTADYYCAAAASGQLKLTLVDYEPICGAMIAAGAPGGARDPQLEHNELELIFVLSAHDNPKLPYEVSPPDCTNGPAGPGIASFKHYPSGSETPDVTVAQSGELYLTTYNPTHVKPATGKFSLSFGGADKVEAEFETYTCN